MLFSDRVEHINFLFLSVPQFCTPLQRAKNFKKRTSSDTQLLKTGTVFSYQHCEPWRAIRARFFAYKYRLNPRPRFLPPRSALESTSLFHGNRCASLICIALFIIGDGPCINIHGVLFTRRCINGSCPLDSEFIAHYGVRYALMRTRSPEQNAEDNEPGKSTMYRRIFSAGAGAAGFRLYGLKLP